MKYDYLRLGLTITSVCVFHNKRNRKHTIKLPYSTCEQNTLSQNEQLTHGTYSHKVLGRAKPYHLKNEITFIKDSPILGIEHDSQDTVTSSGTPLRVILAGGQESYTR